MSSLNFCKMHGLGNDVTIINDMSRSLDFKSLPIAKWADRHRGIGFDQLLLIRPSEKADVACMIFNADGSSAEQCGNGMRCVARFLHEENLIQKKSVSIETKAGIVEASIKNYDEIEINMGVPRIKKPCELSIPYQQSKLTITALSIGNPHAILQVNSVQQCPIKDIAPHIAAHSFFPEGANVGFMEIISKDHIRLRTFERGVGETYACGSNACAAVVAGIQNALLAHKVKVELPYGHLWIEWEGGKAPVFMAGPAARVFSGTLFLNN